MTEFREQREDVLLVAQPHGLQVIEKIHARDVVKDANEVAAGIRRRAPMHEPRIPSHEFQDAPLLFRTPNALHLKGANLYPELLLEDEFEDVHHARIQINGALDPEFWLVIDHSKSPLALVALNEKGDLLKSDNMVPINRHELGRIIPHHRVSREHSICVAHCLAAEPVGCG